MTTAALAAGVVLFQSTLSVRRATGLLCANIKPVFGISIHALRKESDFLRFLVHRLDAISIHALRKESDASSWSQASRPSKFNPRPP